jgi:hypothetical protein
MPELTPTWLGPAHHGWLHALVEHAARFDGRRWGDWAREREAPLRVPAPARLRALACDALEDGWMARARPKPPRRLDIYAAAARARAAGTFDRERLLAPLGGVDLFADLPDERAVVFRAPALPELVAAANLAVAKQLLRRAVRVELALSGGAHAVIRQIRLRRLMWVARPGDEGTRVEVTGVFSLFRQTTQYGREFASLLPVLAGCDRFTLRAFLPNGDVVRLATGDPLPARLPTFDSKLERAFAKGVRAIPGWDLTREPEPLAVDGTLVFPDFAVWRDTAPDRRWLVEIVGFWTPEYLQAKLDRLSRADRSDLLVCIDRRLGCGPEDVPSHLPVVWFDRTIDAAAVLARLGELEGRSPPPALCLGASDLFIDFAGRRDDGIHARLAALPVGARVQLAPRDGRVLVMAPDGEIAALAAHAARRLDLGRVVDARVTGYVERRRADALSPWREKLVVDRWRVPLLALHLAPPGRD